MPLYEYECLNCRDDDGKHLVIEAIRPIARRFAPLHCQGCRGLLRLRISLPGQWKRGWGFLKAASEKSPPAPSDAGFHPEWDSW